MTDDYFAARRELMTAKAEAHESYRQSEPFAGQMRRLGRLTEALLSLVWMSWAQSSRSASLVDNSLMYAGTDDAIQSVVAIAQLVESGIHNTARREGRYLIEQAVKHLFVDQQLPRASREDREIYLKEEVDRSSVEAVWDLDLLVGGETQVAECRKDIKSAWSRMAGYVHPSREQLQERAAQARRGAYIGFETTKELTALCDDIARVHDLLGVMWLTAAGPSAAGDIIVGEAQPNWAFGKTKWLPALFKVYDYKIER